MLLNHQQQHEGSLANCRMTTANLLLHRDTNNNHPSHQISAELSRRLYEHDLLSLQIFPHLLYSSSPLQTFLMSQHAACQQREVFELYCKCHSTHAFDACYCMQATGNAVCLMLQYYHVYLCHQAWTHLLEQLAR